MRKIFYFVSVLFLLICLPSKCFSEDYLTYQSDVGITIQYLDSWQVQDYSSFLSNLPENTMKASIMFLSPKEGNSAKLQANLSLTAIDMGLQAIPLKNFVDQNIEASKGFIQNFKLLEKNESITISSNKAIKVIYSGKMQDGFNVQVMSCYIIKGSIVYTLTFTSEVDKYSRYENIAQTMVDSLIIE